MRIKSYLFSAILFSPLMATAMTAMAGDDNMAPITDALVLKECGSCHFAFQSRFLPKASWQKMMGDLGNHFGEDASLDAGDRDQIEAYLINNAGRWEVDANNPPLRITELKWFKHEHRERRMKGMRNKYGVKSLVDCVACHKGANKGFYDDD